MGAQFSRNWNGSNGNFDNLKVIPNMQHCSHNVNEALRPSRGELHARFFREALAQSGAKRQGARTTPPPCAVKECEMACAGEG